MAKLKYKHSAKTLAEWTELNPIIVRNEIVIEKGVNGAKDKLKCGNGEYHYLDLQYIENDIAGWQGYWVGYIEDPENSCSEPAPKSTILAYRATELARTGNMYYHKFGNSRIFNAFRGAIVNRLTKKVDWYLDKNDFTKKADGTASTPDWTTQNICIIVPNIYRRVIVLNEAGKYEKRFDTQMFDGAELWHEESAHSISFATIDRTAGKLCSVISSDVRFRGGNNDASKDGTNATQIGKPATFISRTGFENYAAAAGWETGNIADRTLWDELYKLYFANSNCQLAYTATLTADGYPQGGTGVGSTQFIGWDTWNGYYPICNVGAGAMNIGCNVGVYNVTINAQTVQIPVFFGLEHLYGELFDWVSGVNLEKSASVENGGTGLNKAFICTDFAKRSDAITADYEYVGNVPREDGWIKQLMPAWNLPFVNAGSGDNVFQSDYLWAGDFPASGSFVRGLLFGASAHYESGAGVRAASAWRDASAANAIIGARLRAKIVK